MRSTPCPSERRRISRWLLPPALLLCSGLALGQEQEAVDAQIKRLETALNRIQAEQQSVYHQFQMVQELRRTEVRQYQESIQVYTPPATPPSYDDVVREKEAREARMRRYDDEVERLYDRYRELEEQKRPLLERLSELARGG
jgi:chromosome segregation ATPase